MYGARGRRCATLRLHIRGVSQTLAAWFYEATAAAGVGMAMTKHK